MKKVALTGASGFVGTNLKSTLEGRGFVVREIERADLKNGDKILEIVEDSDILINLAGAPIIARWSESYKKVLYSSRIDTTKALVEGIKKATKKPSLFISTSAVGRYDNKKTYTDYEEGNATDVLGNITKEWEEEALHAQELGVRTVVFRFGVVLGYGGGMMEKVYPPFSLGLGGTIGDGSQYFSWVHIQDLVNAEMFAIENEKMQGVYNLTAPDTTTNKAFTKTFGEVLHRPTIFPVPVFVLKLLYGEGSVVLSDGQSVAPRKLLDTGFDFTYPDLESALREIVARYKGKS